MTFAEIDARLDGLRRRLEQLEQIPQENYEQFASDILTDHRRNLAEPLDLLLAIDPEPSSGE